MTNQEMLAYVITSVVGRRIMAVEYTKSAEEGLCLTLDNKVKVDLGYSFHHGIIKINEREIRFDLPDEPGP